MDLNVNVHYGGDLKSGGFWVLWGSRQCDRQVVCLIRNLLELKAWISDWFYWIKRRTWENCRTARKLVGENRSGKVKKHPHL